MKINLDTETRAGRMLEAGRVTVTFVSPKTGEHITILAKCRGQVDGKWQATNLEAASIIFFEVPSQGGFNDKVGKLNARGFQADPSADAARVYCAKQLLRFVAGEDMGSLSCAEEARCGKCGRALTDPVSIARGIGPECYGASTGSAHETKVRPEKKSSPAPSAPAPAPAPSAPAPAAPVADTPPYLQNVMDVAEDREYMRRPVASGTDKSGVEYGYGDWRTRKGIAQEEIAERNGGAEARTAPAWATQLSTLPGETWEDIFRPAAVARGIAL